jgi:hypothetical protein
MIGFLVDAHPGTDDFHCPSRPFWSLVLLLLLGGCASRPINPPLTQADPRSGYRFETRQAHVRNKENLVILAFSGGGTRAAAFSYGVLEFLRRTEVVGPAGTPRACSMKSTSSPASRVAASPRWPTASTATGCSPTTSNAS